MSDIVGRLRSRPSINGLLAKIEQRDAEIERLRGLLREAMECGCIISASNPYGLPSGAEWPFDLYERVREALGE